MVDGRCKREGAGTMTVCPVAGSLRNCCRIEIRLRYDPDATVPKHSELEATGLHTR